MKTCSKKRRLIKTSAIGTARSRPPAGACKTLVQHESRMGRDVTVTAGGPPMMQHLLCRTASFLPPLTALITGENMSGGIRMCEPDAKRGSPCHALRRFRPEHESGDLRCCCAMFGH